MAAMPRWAYDAAIGQCRQFQYGGCRGNGNNFLTLHDCQQQCEQQQHKQQQQGAPMARMEVKAL